MSSDISRVETILCKSEWASWRSDWGPLECEHTRSACGVLAAGTLHADARTEPFTPHALLAAATASVAPIMLQHRRNTLIGVSVSGHEVSSGATLAAAARLARDHTAATGVITGAGTAGRGGGLVVALCRSLEPGDELLLWPHPALLRMPALLPRNILAGCRYVCCTCGARFEWPHPLKLHVLTRCAAPRRTALLRVLASPTHTHAPAEGHRCVVCGKLYSRRYGLKIHLRTHTGHKPLRCAVCARAFADPSNLNKHRRLHDQHQHRHKHHPHPPALPLHTIAGAALQRRRTRTYIQLDHITSL